MDLQGYKVVRYTIILLNRPSKAMNNFQSCEYLVAPLIARSAVIMAASVWIVLFAVSLIVVRYIKVLTTAKKESQKSINWNQSSIKTWYQNLKNSRSNEDV
jgi:hypothetical protein